MDLKHETDVKNFLFSFGFMTETWAHCVSAISSVKMAVQYHTLDLPSGAFEHISKSPLIPDQTASKEKSGFRSTTFTFFSRN